MTAPELYVTNFNPRLTGVSTTAAAVTRAHERRYDLRLVGHPLADCPEPIAKSQALRLSRVAPPGRPFAIWHVRRNPEMRLGIWARDVRRLPVRLVFTSAAIRRHSAFPRWLISRMDAVVATSAEAASFVPKVRSVAPHGVDTEVFHPAADRAAAWTDTGYSGEIGIATIGRVRPEKGTDRFVEAMLRLLPDHPHVTALVIGAALGKHQAFAAALKAKVEAAGLAERLIFAGEVPAARMPQLLRSLSLLIALPRYEGYGMTPLEAMSSGVPFVASDQGAFRDFAGQGQAGVVLEDPSAAVPVIEGLLSNPDQLALMARAARDRAVSSYSIQTEADAIADVYESLWAEGKP